MSINIDEVVVSQDSDLAQQRFYKATDEYFKLVNPNGCLLFEGKLNDEQNESVKSEISKAIANLAEWGGDKDKRFKISGQAKTDLESIAPTLQTILGFFEDETVEYSKVMSADDGRLQPYLRGLPDASKNEPSAWLPLVRRLLFKAISAREQIVNKPDKKNPGRKQYTVYFQDLSTRDAEMNEFLNRYKEDLGEDDADGN